MLEDYLFYLKKKVSPNSIPTIMAGIELFFLMNRKIINTKILHKMYPQRVKATGNKAWTTDDVAKCLQVSPSKRSRALIHFVASTGMRIGAIEGLELRHISDMTNNCKAVTLYEETNDEYISFLTPEASNALLEYIEERRRDGENLLPQNPVFRSIYRVGIQKVKPLSRVGAVGIISRSIKNAGLYRNKLGNRYEIQGDHGFRKRFATILKLRNDISYSVTERLLGHKQNLDSSYFRGTKEELFRDFKKAILDLTIDRSERLRLENEAKNAKINELEKEKDRKITEQAEKITILENQVVEIWKGLQERVKVNFEEEIKVTPRCDSGFYFPVKLVSGCK